VIRRLQLINQPEGPTMTIQSEGRVGPWATAREARDLLGVSERTLTRWRKASLLKPGEHWRRKFPCSNSPVLNHLQHCEQTMNEASARSAHLLEPDIQAISRAGRHGQIRRNPH
jgi:hypothetical protein